MYQSGGAILNCCHCPNGQPLALVQTYHETQVSPLVQEITVDIDAVGFAQIFGDQSSNSGKILLLESMFVLNITQLARERSNGSNFHVGIRVLLTAASKPRDLRV